MESGLVIPFVPDDIAELDGFPAILNTVERRIENRGMAVELRIGRAVHRPGRPVNVFRPNHGAGVAVCVPPLFAHPRLGRILDLGHRFAHRNAHGVEDSFIAAQLVFKAYRFGGIEREIRQHPAVAFGPRRERFALWSEVVAQAVIILLPHFAPKS